MYGFDLGLGVAPRRARAVTAAPYSFANPEAQAFVARAPTMSDAWKAAYDALFGRLKAGALNGSNLLAAFDLLYVRAAPSQAAALLNLIGTNWTATLSPNPPPFHAGYGFTANGIDSYVEWGSWRPADGVRYTRNSASFGFWGRRPEALRFASGTTDSGPAAGAITGSPFVNPRSNAGGCSYRINDATTTSAASGITDGAGLHIAVRPDAATKRLFKGATQLGTDAAVASTAPSSVAVREGNAFAAFAENQLPFAFAGRALTAAEVADLHAALAEFLLAIGWAPLIALPGGGDAGIRAAATSTLPAYTARVSLPDAVPAIVAGKGFTNTGLVRDPRDGTWWTCAFGRNVQGDSSSTFQPYIVHLDGDRATALGAIDLVALGVPAAGVQGLAFDTSDNTLWVAVPGSGIHHLSIGATPALIGSPITGLTGLNGLAYDPVRDKLLWATSNSLGYVNKDGTTTGIPSLRASVPYADQLAYAADLDAFLVTGGPNGSAGVLSRAGFGQSYGALRFQRLDLLTGSTAIEGLVRHGGVLTVANDFWYHGSTGALPNSTVLYDAPY